MVALFLCPDKQIYTSVHFGYTFVGNFGIVCKNKFLRCTFRQTQTGEHYERRSAGTN
nr:MAG TPA_asm: hypothetical protein [Caudoviricetes sp.]